LAIIPLDSVFGRNDRKEFGNYGSTDSGVSPARDLALDVLVRVSSGHYAEEVLHSQLQAANPCPEDRRLVTELVYGVLRWRTRLDAVIGRCLNNPRKKLHPRVREILRIALYQIIFLDRIPHRAAVHQAVAQIKHRFGDRVGAFANALLMKVVRERDAVDPAPGPESESLAAYYSHPEWLVRRWLKGFGREATLKTLIINNSRAVLIVRGNRLKISPDELFAFLNDRFIKSSPAFPKPDALAISTLGRPVSLMPGYREGLFTVQESASQLVAPLVGALPGERILDACAAPGGKTSHLAALVRNDARIVATDVDAARLKQTAANLRRLGVTCVEFRLGDVTDEHFLSSLGTFDRALVDAPCSNLGVLRHNPEVKYRIREKDLAVFAQTQRTMLRMVANALRPGGMLVYSVCTTSQEETTGVITEFINKSNCYRIDPIGDHEGHSIGLIDRDGFLRTFPPEENRPVDGFFAARIIRNRQMCE
jgi:16S rRNA (cytosine967-C5)-methyltransferase